MQGEISNWPSAIVEIAKYLIPAAITAIVSIVLSRHQWKIKNSEIRAQGELRARELLFEAYQKKLEQINIRSHDAGQTVGKFIAEIMAAETEQEKEEILQGFSVIVRGLEVDLTDSINEMEEQLRKANLFEKRKKDISFIREHLAVDLNKLTVKEMEALQFKVVKALDIESRLLQDLLNKKCEDLFRVYLNGA